MLRKIIGTLTLSSLNSMHILTFPIILYKSYSMASLKYPKPFTLEN
jgi:hypothetical protein